MSLPPGPEDRPAAPAGGAGDAACPRRPNFDPPVPHALAVDGPAGAAPVGGDGGAGFGLGWGQRGEHGHRHFAQDHSQGADWPSALAESTRAMRKSVYDRNLAVEFGRLKLEEITPVRLKARCEKIKERGPQRPMFMPVRSCCRSFDSFRLAD